MQHKEAFVTIVQENEGLIYKVTRIYSNSKEDGQDLYQEIVYQLWKAFGSFRNDAKISTWIYRIALNTAITQFNKAKRKQQHLPAAALPQDIADNTDTLMQERSETLFALIKKLNEVEKAIVLLYLEGKSYAEIAEITGFTPSNIGTRLGRIKQKLSAQIN